MPPRLTAAALLLPVVLGCCAVNGNALNRESREPSPERIFAGSAGGGDFYAGNGSCRSCHEELFRQWKATVHSGSYATLAAGGSETDPACLRCHATGYGEHRGFTDVRATPELANVGCEACHGPSGDHARSRFPGIVGTARGSDCGDCEVSRICRKCHTRRQSPDFVLAKGLERVSCFPPLETVPGVSKGEK